MASRVTSTNWVKRASGDNTLIVATHPAHPGMTHVITGFHASFSTVGGANGSLLEIKNGGSVMDDTYVHDVAGFVYADPMRATKGNAVSVELAASGVAGRIGKVTLMGYSKPEGFLNDQTSTHA